MASAMAGVMPIPSGGNLGRLMQGLSGVGGKISTVLGAGQGAAQGLTQGVGFAAGQLVAQPVKGIAGWFLNFLPENIYGFFIWGAAFLYFLDWQTGFNISIMGGYHWWFYIASFLLIGVTQKVLSGWGLVFSAMLFIALRGIMNVGISGSTILSREFILPIAGLVAVFFLYIRRFGSAPGFFKWMPILAFMDVYGMPIIVDKLVGYAANIGYAAFFFTFLMNRALFPFALWYGGLSLYENTRVAKRFLLVAVLFYFIVSLPTVRNVYNAKVAGLTPEQVEMTEVVKGRFWENIRSIVSGEFLRAPVAAAYGKAEETFGFGTPKEEPKIGLVLKADPTMPKEFDLSYGKKPNPGFVLSIPNPFPPNVEQPYIQVINIECKAKPSDGSTDLEATSVVSDTGVPFPKDKYVVVDEKEAFEVYYMGPNGGAGVTCYFDNAVWKDTSYTLEASVKYVVKTNAYLENSFMRLDQVKEMRRNGLDPVVVKKLPVATAKYDNTPVSLTWGPIALTNTPATIDITKDGQNQAIRLYAAKSAGWEKGELYGIEKLTLTLPEGIVLAGDYCDFKTSRTKNVYEVNQERIKKDGKYKFFGDSARFDCGMNVKKDLLSSADWAAARFEASGTFIFENKFTGASFKVTGAQKTQSSTGSTGSTEGTTITVIDDKATVWKGSTADYTKLQSTCNQIKGATFTDIQDESSIWGRCTCPSNTKWVSSTDVTKGCA